MSNPMELILETLLELINATSLLCRHYVDAMGGTEGFQQSRDNLLKLSAHIKDEIDRINEDE